MPQRKPMSGRHDGPPSVPSTASDLIVTVDDLLLLAEVIDAGGFSAASARSGIGKSQLSRRIAALEDRLGVELLKRSSRRFEVTEIGRRLHEQALQIRMAAQTAVTLAADSGIEPSGVLRVACPMVLLITRLSIASIEFAKRYPRVRLCMSTTMGLSELSADRYDILIHPTAIDLPDSDIVAQRLVTVAYAIVATPDLAGLYKHGEGPPILAHLPAIGWNNDEAQASWPLIGPDGQKAHSEVRLRFSSDNLLTIREAALAGLGIARLPLSLCRDDIEAGRLRVVAPGWGPPAMSMYALYLSRRRLGLAAQAFIELLKDVVADLEVDHAALRPIIVPSR